MRHQCLLGRTSARGSLTDLSVWAVGTKRRLLQGTPLPDFSWRPGATCSGNLAPAFLDPHAAGRAGSVTSQEHRERADRFFPAADGAETRADPSGRRPRRSQPLVCPGPEGTGIYLDTGGHGLPGQQVEGGTGPRGDPRAESCGVLGGRPILLSHLPPTSTCPLPQADPSGWGQGCSLLKRGTRGDDGVQTAGATEPMPLTGGPVSGSLASPCLPGVGHTRNHFLQHVTQTHSGAAPARSIPPSRLTLHSATATFD